VEKSKHKPAGIRENSRNFHEKIRGKDRDPLHLRAETSYNFAAMNDRAREHDAFLRRQELKPYDARQMRCFPISTRTNRVANDDEECCRAVELSRMQPDLFLQT
jgi:hypothetical protein